MARKKTEALPVATTLTGAENVVVTQSGNSRRTTTASIAALAGSGSAIVSPNAAVSLTAADSGLAVVGTAALGGAATNGLGVTAGGLVGLVPLGGGQPDAHAASHATGGSDPLTPAAIGAATTGALAAVSTSLSTHVADVANPHAVTAVQTGAMAEYPLAPATHTEATLTLANSNRNTRQRVSAASNAVAIRIPDSIQGGSSGDSTAFETCLIITDVTNAVTISIGAGLLTPVLYPTGAAITKANTQVVISVVRGVAYVAIVPPDAEGVDGAPDVQTVHTSPTRLIAVGDANAILPFSSASNAVAITVPHTLFGALGTNKAFVFSGEVRNIANPITLVGSGGLVLKHYGPRTTLTTVDDTFVVVVISATLARVYIAAAL